MLGFKWRSLFITSAVAIGATIMVAPSADAGWGYGGGYRGFRAPVVAYRPAYVYAAPRYVAPVRRVYRPVVPVVPVVRVAPVRVVPYQTGYRGYSPYGSYRAGYGGYGYGVAPVGYIGY